MSSGMRSDSSGAGVSPSQRPFLSGYLPATRGERGANQEYA